MKFEPKELWSMFALLLATTAAFLIIVLLYPNGKPTIHKKTAVSVMDTVQVDTTMKAVSDSLLKIKADDGYRKYLFNAKSAYLLVVNSDCFGFTGKTISIDTLSELTIYDPTITVVWDTLGYKQ